MANCGTKRSNKKKYGSGGEIIKKLETAAVNAVSKLTHPVARMKQYKSKKIK